jgi:hypothetical protein
MQTFQTLSVLVAAALSPVNPPSSHANACPTSAEQADAACRKQALADFWLQRATCTNLADDAARLQCVHDAFAELQDAKSLCGDQNAARLDVCARLGGGPYDPSVDPRHFVQGIDNPYMTLAPGTTFVFENRGRPRGGVERNVVTVLPETEDILGVECTTVHDVVFVGDEKTEDTLDWFAQDDQGNVWYFGELSYTLENGRITDIGGSWRAGVDGAKPGIVMLAAPRIGDFYRQEYQVGVAEDVAAVLSLSDPVTVPFGSFASCLLTEESSPLEPGAIEHKDYAAGIGIVLTIEDDGSRSELVEIR